MFVDLITRLSGNGTDQCVEVIAFKESHLPAVLAKQKMLMPVPGRDECLAAHWLMHALNEVQFFELLQRAIDRDQTECAVFFAPHVVHLPWSEGAGGFFHRFHHSSSRSGNTVSIFLQLGEPQFSRHNHSFLVLKIIINKCKR